MSRDESPPVAFGAVGGVPEPGLQLQLPLVAFGAVGGDPEAVDAR